MQQVIRLGVVGAGLIGRRHLEATLRAPGVRAVAVADPDAGARDLAASHDCAWFDDLAPMLAAGGLDGVILATPNALHVAQGLACIAAGLPVLVEKPLATDVGGAERLVAAAEAAGVALLTGHHRRHNPLVGAAKAAIEAGRIGRIVAAQTQCWLYKPDDYFETAWRRAPGAGPVFINLIHDIDLLRHLCGEIVEVQAMDSAAVRGHAVEDTAVILLRFASGALGTVTVSDTIVAPWSWELTAAENPAYPPTAQSCTMIGGTEGALALPDLTFWEHRGEKSWWAPISATREPVRHDDPLVAQLRQFAAVIRGEAAPLVSGADGLAALRVIAAVKEAAASGERCALV